MTGERVEVKKKWEEYEGEEVSGKERRKKQGGKLDRGEEEGKEKEETKCGGKGGEELKS